MPLILIPAFRRFICVKCLCPMLAFKAYSTIPVHLLYVTSALCILHNNFKGNIMKYVSVQVVRLMIIVLLCIYFVHLQ